MTPLVARAVCVAARHAATPGPLLLLLRLLWRLPLRLLQLLLLLQGAKQQAVASSQVLAGKLAHCD